jgi:hypothetical protein
MVPNSVHLPTSIPLDPSTIWRTAFHWNGVAVYHEGGARGAYAASIDVRASPSIVFDHFVRLNDGSCSWDFFSDVKVLDPLPENDKKLVRPWSSLFVSFAMLACVCHTCKHGLQPKMHLRRPLKGGLVSVM